MSGKPWRAAVWGMALLLLFSAVMSYCQAAPAQPPQKHAFTLEVLKQLDNQAPQAGIVLFDGHPGPLTGWNHTGNFASEFRGLRLPAEYYEVNHAPALNGIYSTVLVKKLGDWDHQHGNGLMLAIPKAPARFADIVGIELYVKINADQSYVPDEQLLLETYGSLVDKQQLAALDDSNIYLSFALVGVVSDSVTFNADYLLKLSPQHHTNRWLRVYIPRGDLTLYTEEHYEEQAISESDAQNQLISSLRIMAETASTKVVRNLLLNQFNQHTPRLFKEIAVELRFVTLLQQ